MENNVIISIKGKQSYEDMEDETIELVTEGRLDPDGTEGYTLSYQESGSIEIDYAIEIDHAVAGQNLFQINVREKRPILQQ